MITGYICLLFIIALFMKVLGRISKCKQLNKALRKIHKPFEIILIGIVIAHLLLTCNVWNMRAQSVIITGVITVVLLFVMLVTYLLHGKLQKTWMIYHRIGASVLLIMLVLHIGTYFYDFHSYHQAIHTMNLSEMTAKGMKDGSYIGEYSVGYIKAKVEVVVKGEKIEAIHVLDHKNERGAKAEAILSEMVEHQTTKVDAVSGATNSSKVLRKAVESALQNGK